MLDRRAHDAGRRLRAAASGSRRSACPRTCTSPSRRRRCARRCRARTAASARRPARACCGSRSARTRCAPCPRSAATAPPRRAARRSCRARPAVPLPSSSDVQRIGERSYRRPRLDGDRLVLRHERRRFRFAAIRRAHVVDDDALEFLGDALALQRDGLLRRRRRPARPASRRCPAARCRCSRASIRPGR